MRFNLSWLSYRQILQALGENNRAHLFYDRGTLEITMPLEEHEFYRELIGRFIYFLVSELGLKIKSLGSTTLAREDLERGAEPDNAYYIQNQAKVLGKRINLTEDPPPDLVVEVDITHTDINKLALYARLGVPELWRFNGQIWRIYRLKKEVYQEEEFSPTFPLVPKTASLDLSTSEFWATIQSLMRRCLGSSLLFMLNQHTRCQDNIRYVISSANI